MTRTPGRLVPRRTSPVPRARVDGPGRLPRGLRLVPGFAPPAGQREALAWIAEHVRWSGGSTAGLRSETWLDGHRPLPPWAVDLADRMRRVGLVGEVADYLHLLHYPRGTGLPDHVDAADLGDVVAGLTLGSSRVLVLTRPRRLPVRVLLQPGDLYVLAGPSRWGWAHGVPACAVDVVRGVAHPRTDGLSATWRRVRPGTGWADHLRSTPPAHVRS